MCDASTIVPAGQFGSRARMQDFSINGNNALIEDYRNVNYGINSIATPNDVAVYNTSDRFTVLDRALFVAAQSYSSSTSFPQPWTIVEDTFNPMTQTVRDINLSFSIAFWVSVGDDGGRNGRIMGVNQWAGFQKDSRDRYSFVVPNPGAGQPDFVVADPTPLEEGVWTFLCITVGYDPMTNETRMQLWRDGARVQDDPGMGTVGSLTVPIPFVNTSLSFFEIGGDIVDDDPGTPGLQGRIGTEAFVGALDDIRVYNRPLEPLVVQSLYFENGFFPAPESGFTFDPSTPQASPVTISFRDASVGQINEWDWTFGDPMADPVTNPNRSTLRDPQHTYASPGTYTVTLTVRGLGGTSTISLPVQVN